MGAPHSKNWLFLFFSFIQYGVANFKTLTIFLLSKIVHFQRTLKNVAEWTQTRSWAMLTNFRIPHNMHCPYWAETVVPGPFTDVVYTTLLIVLMKKLQKLINFAWRSIYFWQILQCNIHFLSIHNKSHFPYQNK